MTRSISHLTASTPGLCILDLLHSQFLNLALLEYLVELQEGGSCNNIDVADPSFSILAGSYTILLRAPFYGSMEKGELDKPAKI